MGEARRRGTYKQRKSTAIEQALEQRILAKTIKKRIISPEEKERRKCGGALLSTLYGAAMANGTLMPYRV